jgi:hypothetical protein
VEIAAGIQAALRQVLPKISIFADGVPDSPALREGDESPEEMDLEARNYPIVGIMVAECLPMYYRSALREYPFGIVAATWEPHDPHQEELYRMAYQVGLWLAEPALTLTLVHWDSLVIANPPERDNDGRVQLMTWNGTNYTRKA